MGALLDFLLKKQVQRRASLPLVHSTEAYHLKKIIQEEKIIASPCGVFSGENLNYFFVGRPAFKRSIVSEPEHWQLPVCLIMQFDCVAAKRVYPFDSGAFAAHLYPQFITMMEMDEFEVSRDRDAAEKIIGAFFASNKMYYKLRPTSRESFETAFDLDALDAEIKALHQLIGTKSGVSDDRRFAIEIQTDHNIGLANGNLLAIVIPEIYLASMKLVSAIETDFGAKIISYPEFPLRKEYYYYSIYERVDKFYQDEGFYRV